MRRETAPFARRVALVAAVVGLALPACETTVNDLEKWRNRPRSEQKFVQWMLEPEASPDVRSKAIEMLFEQYNYEGAAHLPRVAELPAEHRDRAILDALPHIRELLDGAEFSLGSASAIGRLRPVQVRDGAIMLLNATDNPEVQARIHDEILVPWLREHYRPCITSTGRHPNSRILTMVGPERGLPIVAGFIRNGTLEDVICQDSYLAEVAWLPETSEELATAYTARWSANPPEAPEHQRHLVAAMVTVPRSRVLKNWMFAQLLESDAPLLPDVVDAFLDYVKPLTDATDAERYAAMVQRFDGFLRWIGLENVIRLRGAPGIPQALAAIPDAGVWGRWGGDVLPDGLRRAANWVCARPHLAELGEPARVAFEGALDNSNLVARAIAIHCLRDLGTAETIPLLQGQLAINAIIPSWGGQSQAGGDPSGARGGGDEDDEGAATTTIGELSAEVIAAIEARLAGGPEEGGPGPEAP
jgi:hypothetical protein